MFIIDNTGIIRHITINDLPGLSTLLSPFWGPSFIIIIYLLFNTIAVHCLVGRNVDETLRLVKAFQHTDKHGEVCPINWQPGSKTVQAPPPPK
jgi:alkyl hydroperoxide reductase subunit AhpC